MRRAGNISQEETVELLNKCWMTHDGMWFFHCLQNLGIDATNKINKAAIKSLSAIEIARIRKILDCFEPLETFDAFKNFFSEATSLMIPDFMNVTFSFPEKNIMTWQFNHEKCFAYAGVKRLGAIEKYECGVLYRIKCWLDEFTIKHAFFPEIGRCHMQNSGDCSGKIQLFLT
jgi:hypothetical protein